MTRSILLARLDDALAQARKALQSPDHCSLIPSIIQCLEYMKVHVDDPPAKRDHTAGGLGRIVTDDDPFGDSPFGARLLELADDYAAGRDAGDRCSTQEDRPHLLGRP